MTVGVVAFCAHSIRNVIPAGVGPRASPPRRPSRSRLPTKNVIPAQAGIRASFGWPSVRGRLSAIRSSESNLARTLIVVIAPGGIHLLDEANFPGAVPATHGYEPRERCKRCAWLVRMQRRPGVAARPSVDHEQPLVEPQVSHLRQVPFLTMVKFWHSGQEVPS